MSIQFSYYRLSSTERESVTHDQAAWDQFLKLKQSAYHQSRHEALASIQDLAVSPKEKLEKLELLLRERRDPRRFDLHKGWHTIGYLLTGKTGFEAAPEDNNLLYNVIFTGSKTSVTTGYGAVCCYDERKVNQSADALRDLDRSLIIERFEPAKMAKLDIYAPPEKNEQDSYLRIIDELTAFFREAATASENVIKFVV